MGYSEQRQLHKSEAPMTIYNFRARVAVWLPLLHGGLFMHHFGLKIENQLL